MGLNGKTEVGWNTLTKKKLNNSINIYNNYLVLLLCSNHFADLLAVPHLYGVVPFDLLLELQDAV